MNISKHQALRVLEERKYDLCDCFVECDDKDCELMDSLKLAIKSLRDSKDKKFLIWQVEHIIVQLDQPHNADLIRLLKEILEMIKKTHFDEDWKDVRDGLPTESGEYLVTYLLDNTVEMQQVVWFDVDEQKWSTEISDKDVVLGWKKSEPYKRREVEENDE